MRIERFRYLGGPNVHHHLPVLVAELELEDLAERESREFEGFNDRLLERLPGLRSHTCGGGYEGCFVERLRDGTYFGHIVEHVAIELSGHAGIAVCYGKTRVIAEPGVVLDRGALSQRGGDAASAAGARWSWCRPARGRDYRARGRDRPRRAGWSSAPSSARAPGASSMPRDRGIPCAGSTSQQPGAARLRPAPAADPGGVHRRDQRLGADIALRQEPHQATPARGASSRCRPARRSRPSSRRSRSGRDIGECVVVKPVDGNQGKGVTTDVRSIEALRAAFESAAAQSSTC